MRRVLIVLAAAVILAGAVGAGLLAGVVLAPVRSSAVTLAMPGAAAGDKPVRPPLLPLPVQSFAPEDAYPLEDWRIDTAEGGALSHVSLAGPRPRPLDDGPLEPDDVLLVTGWVGDPLLGVPFRHVVFSLCGRIVGAARAGEPRPDVTRHLHPNLVAPGWTARLAVAHLPRCADPVLEAWAADAASLLYPLPDPVPLELPDAAGQAPSDLVASGPLRPQDLPAFDRRVIDIAAPRGALLRRCGDLTCEVFGGIAYGRHAAMVLDDSHPDWVLLIADGQVGWLSRGLFSVVEP